MTLLNKILGVAVSTDMQLAHPVIVHCLNTAAADFQCGIYLTQVLTLHVAMEPPLTSHMILQMVFVPIAGAYMYSRCMHSQQMHAFTHTSVHRIQQCPPDDSSALFECEVMG